jgi:hypothetical protein
MNKGFGRKTVNSKRGVPGKGAFFTWLFMMAPLSLAAYLRTLSNAFVYGDTHRYTQHNLANAYEMKGWLEKAEEHRRIARGLMGR